MARIRSIHPGLFTDEAFASLSMAARVLLLGIWTEADDHGVFEWKPVTLKMRLMPVDNVSIPDLLLECEAHEIIKQFSDGKSYGLVRNFCRYQRPKKPKYVHPMPPEFYTYAGLNADGSLQVLHQSRTGTENPPQREEGGDNMEEEKEEGEGSKPARAKNLKSDGRLSLEWSPSLECRTAIASMGFHETQFNSEYSKFTAYHMSRGSNRADWDATLISWFQRTSPAKPPPPDTSSELPIEQAVKFYAKTRKWSRHAGPEPGLTGCRAPPEMLEKYGLLPDGRPVEHQRELQS